MDPIPTTPTTPIMVEGGSNSFIFKMYESSLVYWLIFAGIIGIIYYTILIYLKIKMGEKWKNGIIKWMLEWYLDKTKKKIQLTKNSEILTPIFEKLKENIGID